MVSAVSEPSSAVRKPASKSDQLVPYVTLKEYSFEDFRCNKKCSSLSGRYWVYGGHYYEGPSFVLIDRYFHSRTVFAIPDYATCLILFDDLSLVASSGNQLIWYRLICNPEETRAEELYRKALLIDEDISVCRFFALDDGGRNFLTYGGELDGHYLYYHRMDFRTVNGVEERIWKSHPIKFTELPYAARLSKSHNFIWFFSISGLWSVQLSNMKPRHFPFAVDSQLKEVYSGNWKRIHFLSAEYAVGFSVPTHTLKPISTLFLIRLNEEKGAELKAESRYAGAGNIICDESSVHIQSFLLKVAHIQMRRPQPLLLIAHTAALQSGRRWALPPNLSIARSDGLKPSYRL